MQIVGYETRDGDGPAALVVAEEGTVLSQSLAPGEELSSTLGERHCAGAISDGSHESCDRDSAPYCDEHVSRWPCARCTGTCAMPIAACHEEHAVYLAAFAPATVKVGVTRSWRLDTRLREQGADKAAHIRTVKNGRIARQIEADLAERFPDRVRVRQKIESVHRSVADDAWTALVDEFDPIETYDFDYGLSLEIRPVHETMANGTVLGTQGRILVLERSGTKYAVDLRDLVGYDVADEPAGRTRQSSFGSFG